MMKLIDRYVIGLYGRGAALFGAACIALYITVDFFDKVDNLFDHPSLEKFQAAGAYYFLQVPLILHYLLPSIALLAGMASVATLTRGAELATLQSSGLSVRRALAGTFLIAGLLTGFAFINQEIVLPAVAMPLEEATVALKQKPVDPDDDTRFYNPTVAHDKAGWVMQMGTIDTATGEVEGVTAIRRSKDRQTLLTARRGVYDNDAGGWYFYEGQIQTLSQASPEIVRVPFGPGGYFLLTEISPESILRSQEETLFLRRDEIHARAREHPGIASLRVQYYNRLAAPFSPLVLVAAGLPLCLRRRGQTLAAGIFLTIVTAGLFFFAQIFCTILGAQCLMTAQLAAFLPASLFLAWSAWAWAKVKT